MKRPVDLKFQEDDQAFKTYLTQMCRIICKWIWLEPDFLACKLDLDRARILGQYVNTLGSDNLCLVPPAHVPHIKWASIAIQSDVWPQNFDGTCFTKYTQNVHQIALSFFFFLFYFGEYNYDYIIREEKEVRRHDTIAIDKNNSILSFLKLSPRACWGYQSKVPEVCASVCSP